MQKKLHILSIILGLLLVLYVPLVLGEEQVVINSKDWRDVYTGFLYGLLQGIDVHYVAQETQGVQLYEEVLDRRKKEVLLIESAEAPFLFGYQASLTNVGFGIEKLQSSDPHETSLALAERLFTRDQLNGVIIVDSAIGASAISVASYALLTKSSVIFADGTNIQEIVSFLSEFAPKELLLYGRLDRAVKDQLEQFNPKEINFGDRYEDNIKIAELFLQQRPGTKQVYFTDGTFLEPGLFTSEFPLLFLGTSNIPPLVIAFVEEHDIATGVVTGYDLYASARRIRKETGMRIFLKYAQGRNEELYALDIFPVPSYAASVRIADVQYNTFTKKLEVVYKNELDSYTYVQVLGHDIFVDGTSVDKVGEDAPFIMEGKRTRTVAYSADLTDYLDRSIIVRSRLIYGESAGSLDNLLEQEFEVAIISIDDSSSIAIEKVVYNKRTKRFEVTIRNTGKVAAYVEPELLDIIIAEEKNTLVADQQRLAPDASKTFKIKASLEAIDFEENPKILVQARFGSRSDALLKRIRESYPLLVKEFSLDAGIILLGAIVLIAFFLLLAIRRKKKRVEHA